MSSITVPSKAHMGDFPPAISDALISVATSAKADLDASTRTVRGVVTANVSDLTDHRRQQRRAHLRRRAALLLVGQTTAEECGIYVVGTVTTGAAPLTLRRRSRRRCLHRQRMRRRGQRRDAVGRLLVEGHVYRGQGHRHRRPAVLPALAAPHRDAGGRGLTFDGDDALFLFSTTKSQVTVTRNTANTSTSTTGGYAARSPARRWQERHRRGAGSRRGRRWHHQQRRRVLSRRCDHELVSEPCPSVVLTWASATYTSRGRRSQSRPRPHRWPSRRPSVAGCPLTSSRCRRPGNTPSTPPPACATPPPGWSRTRAGWRPSSTPVPRAASPAPPSGSVSRASTSQSPLDASA